MPSHSICDCNVYLEEFHSVLENENGEPVYTDEEFTGTIVEYFSKLFKSVPG
ncbi:hypothetical protein F2Q69_00015148 [Brassica cretica]|uniref:Uncharacterized protein n=2 Tax=Brassica cretica TaxID=69181 RepID=A0A8S9R4C1_BRACR|nr:hypothetical protein F2Q69_00015148 [Brassica cretica]KAF3577353.1 hypothetical protein DY000_02032632 [Brassica cretica]